MSVQTHHYQQLIDAFDGCFADTLNTRLIKGDEEPLYLPDDDAAPYHRIIFAHGYYTSALHEIAHWCIAGARRRLLVDFGYWYCPDGGDADTQARFERAEIKPQALEWMFCGAAGFPFDVSCDNLNGDCEPNRILFQRQVHAQVMLNLENGVGHARRHLYSRCIAIITRHRWRKGSSPFHQTLTNSITTSPRE